MKPVLRRNPILTNKNYFWRKFRKPFPCLSAAALGAAISGIIVVIALWNAVSHANLLVWLTGFLALYASRQALAWAFHKASPSSSEIVPWAKWYYCGSHRHRFVVGSGRCVTFSSGFRTSQVYSCHVHCRSNLRSHCAPHVHYRLSPRDSCHVTPTLGAIPLSRRSART